MSYSLNPRTDKLSGEAKYLHQRRKIENKNKMQIEEQYESQKKMEKIELTLFSASFLFL